VVTRRGSIAFPFPGALGILKMARQQHSSPPKLRVFLVDDEPVVRRGLRLLLSLQDNLTICGEAASENEAFEGISKLRPHLAVVDLSFEEGDGLSLIKRLRQLCPTLKIMVFSMHDQVDFATAAFAAGAHGYVVKEEGSEKVVEAIQVIMSGGCYLSERIAAKAPGLVQRAGVRGRPQP
jgi:DNA-binding NarL/FixJ family response regulator